MQFKDLIINGKNARTISLIPQCEDIKARSRTRINEFRCFITYKIEQTNNIYQCGYISTISLLLFI